MNIGHQQARKYLQELHADGDLYISGWIRKRNAVHHAVYGLAAPGNTDEPRPEPITRSESMKRYRASIKSKEQYDQLTSRIQSSSNLP